MHLLNLNWPLFCCYLTCFIQNSGCFGCCMKPTPIIAVDEPAKGLRIQGQTVRKPHISDGFWSSSTGDLDNSNIQSQRSISSVSTLNQILYHSSGTSTAGANPEFANPGKFYIVFVILSYF